MFVNDNDFEFYFDVIVIKFIFLVRMGLIRVFLNFGVKVLGELFLLIEKCFFGDGVIENMEFEIGFNMFYLGENKCVLELCFCVEIFFYIRFLFSFYWYY